MPQQPSLSCPIQEGSIYLHALLVLTMAIRRLCLIPQPSRFNVGLGRFNRQNDCNLRVKVHHPERWPLASAPGGPVAVPAHGMPLARGQVDVAGKRPALQVDTSNRWAARATGQLAAL